MISSFIRSYFLNSKKAAIVIGFLSVAVATTGLICSTLNYCEVFNYVEDPSFIAILYILFFIGVPGITFHAILLIFSTMLMLGAYTEIPALLVFWMAWIPFTILAIVISMALQLEEDTSHVIPVVCVFMMVLLLALYGLMGIAWYFKELIRLQSGWDIVNMEYPSTENSNRIQRFFAIFKKGRRVRQVTILSSSTEIPDPSSSLPDPTHQGAALSPQERKEIKDALSKSYASLLASEQMPKESNV